MNVSRQRLRGLHINRMIPNSLTLLALACGLTALRFALQARWEPAVLAIVAQALLRVAGRALQSRFKQGLAAASLIALAAFDAPFPIVIAAAALIGALISRTRPEWLGAHASEPLQLTRVKMGTR